MEAECVRERNGVWHLVGGDGDADFRPIACSQDEGIVAPGPGYRREPTCPECLAIGDGDE